MPTMTEDAVKSYQWMERLLTLSPRHALWLCALLFVAIACVDFITPPLKLGFLYAVVVFIACWNVGTAAGITFALLGTGVEAIDMWSTVSPTQGFFRSLSWYIALANRVTLLGLVVALVHPLRRLFGWYQTTLRVDALTGVANRARLEETLHAEIDRSLQTGDVFSVLYLECVNFRRIIESTGNNTQSEVLLRAIADTFGKRARSYDTLARTTDVDFAAVLPATNADDAKRIARSWLDDLREAVEHGRWSGTLTVGVATFEHTALTPNEVIEINETLMYRMKKLGSGNIAYEQIDLIPQSRVAA